MTGFDKEQLDALRRQVEEEFRLDLAAIERLQRRYAGVAGIPAAIPGGVPNGNYAPASSSVASNSYPSASAAYSSQGNGLNADTRSRDPVEFQSAGFPGEGTVWSAPVDVQVSPLRPDIVA